MTNANHQEKPNRGSWLCGRLGQFTAMCATVLCAFSVSAASVDKYYEYIETDGAGNTKAVFVTLDYIPTWQTVVEAKFEDLDATTTTSLFCSRTGNGSGTDNFSCICTSSKYRWDYGKKGSETSAPTGVHTITCRSDGLYIDGVRKLTTTPKSVSDEPKPTHKMVLFGAYNGGAGNPEPVYPPSNTYPSGAHMKVYSVKIWDDNGETLKLDLRPCVDTDGKAAFYDAVNKCLYYGMAFNGSVGLTVGGSEVIYDGPDVLTISGEPENVGLVAPAYGKTNKHAVGETVACSAPSAVTSGEGNVVYDCMGYKVYTNGVVYVEGEENSFTYEHPDCENGAKLVWQWSVKRKVAVSSRGAGTAVVSGDGWFVEGDPVTVTATPQDGAAFHHWEGDVPAEQVYAATLAFPMGAEPRSLTAVFSSVVYVSKDGNDSWDGSSWDTAFASVERALQEGDAPYITVGEGLYEINTAINVTNAAVIVGSGNRGAVFKLESVPGDGDAKRGVFYVKNVGAVLRNLAMTTGGSARGRGLYLNGGLVENCSITNCATVNGNMNGGGVYLASGTVRDSLIADNVATSSGGYGREGGGVHMTGGLLDRCIVRGNSAAYNKGKEGSGYGGGIRQSGGTVRNCLVVGNYSRSSGAGVRITGGTLENCTIVRNGLNSLAVPGLRVENKPTIRNTIVRGNITSSGTEDNVSLGTTPTQATLEAILTQGLDHSAVITSDPAFVDSDADDWHILYGACVDAGVNQDWMATATDLDGLARINGQRVDIGCYEYVPNGLACGFDVTSDGALDKSDVTLTGTVIGADPANVTFTWTVTDGFGHETVRSGKGLSVLVLPTQVGSYSVSLVVSDGEHTADVARENAFTVYAKDIYVAPKGSAVYPYVDFATAATNLHEALSVATDGSTMHIADGVYTLKDRLVVNAGVRIEHLGNREDCVVTGGRSGTCLILVDHRDAVLTGLDVCGSYPAKYVPGSGMAAPTIYISNGVRIGASGGTVTNCVVESCYVPNGGGDSGSGGGINMSAGLVVDSLIRNNAILSSGGGGSTGGGIFVGGNGLVDRCVVTNNHATGGSACAGGGVRVEGSGMVRNSLVAYCKSTTGGGISRNGGTARNCTVVCNTASTSVGGVKVDANIIDCLAFNNTANGVGEDLDDPGFKDAAHGDFHLATGSAAIDASVTEGIGELDLDGNARYQGLDELRADKGCYEFDPTVFELGIGYKRLSTFYPGDVRFSVGAGGVQLDEEKCWWTFDGREPTAEDHDATGQTVARTMAPGEYTVRFKTVYDEKAYEVKKEKWFVLYGETVYVNPNCTRPAVPYASWETAATNINDALKCLVAGSTMVVSDGVYRVTSEQNLNRQVTIRSLNGPTVTKFTGSRPFHLNSSLATVAGFAFEKLDMWDGGAMRISNGTVSNCVFASCVIQNNGGAAVYMTEGTVVDCVVTNCSTRYSKGQLGAAIHAKGANAFIDRCIVTGSYWQGSYTNNAAVALEGGAKMRNSVVADNRGGATGGVLLTGASAMENCTVTGNTAYFADGVGGVSAADTASVVNTIIWSNMNAKIGEASEKSGADTVYDTCCTEDPVFRGGKVQWRLKAKSPCMNAGKPLDWMDGAKDVYGNPRVLYGKPDIGAVESPYEPGLMLMVR